MWDKIWATYAAQIAGYVHRHVRDYHAAEDLASQVFVNAMQAEARGAGCQEHIRGWLHSIARNLVIDHYRASCNRHQHVDIDDMSIIDPDDDPVYAAEQADDAQMVAALLRQLTPMQARVMRLRYYDGYSFDEIGGVLGISEGAAKHLRLRSVHTMHRLVSAPRPKQVGVKELIVDCLTRLGPLTAIEIAAAMNGIYNTIFIALNKHKETFVQVDRRKGKKRMAAVWGIIGLHDKGYA